MSSFRPQYIVVHTAAFKDRNCDKDTIDRWHRDRGWNGVGYHYVIVNDKHDEVADGTVQDGRDIRIQGAHARGLNSRSIGICCVGHGDFDPFTEKQTKSLIGLISRLIDDYEDITVDRVIGHRELNTLVAGGLLRAEYSTTKNCPGKKVDMDLLRDQILQHRKVSEIAVAPSELPPDRQSEVNSALTLLEQTAAEVFPNAAGEFKEFLTHPEVIAFRDSA